MDEQYSPDEIVKLGEAIYFKIYEKELKPHNGQYVVIDVSTEKFTVGQDRLKAIEEAETKFGKKLFYLAQIGNLKKEVNFHNSEYAWKF